MLCCADTSLCLAPDFFPTKSHKAFLRQILPTRPAHSGPIPERDVSEASDPFSLRNRCVSLGDPALRIYLPIPTLVATTEASLTPRSGIVPIVPEHILNIKELNVISKVNAPPKDVFNIVCDNIIAKMTQHNTVEIISLRDNIYDILLYGLDVTECLWYILYYFVENEIFVDESGEAMSEIMDKINSFLKYYNNNYRPIYHLESMFIYLIIKIYKYPSSPNEPNTII